jgi:hypothetical protein
MVGEDVEVELLLVSAEAALLSAFEDTHAPEELAKGRKV